MLSQREVLTRFQVDTVLSVIAMTLSGMGHFLRSPNDPIDSTTKIVPSNSEAHIAVENTLQAACARLDQILADEKRWDTKFQDKVEADYEEAHRIQIETYVAQRDAAAEVFSPHFRYRPTLHRLMDGTWCAFLGDLEHMDQGIVGIGQFPREAMEAFDDAFNGIINEKVLAWCKAREHAFEQGTEFTAPFPSQEQTTNDTQTLDPGRIETPGNPQEEGHSQEGDCPPT